MNIINKIAHGGANFLCNTYKGTVFSIKHFKESPLEHLENILFGLAILLGIINFLVTLTLFFINGGYSNPDIMERSGYFVVETFNDSILWKIDCFFIIAIAFLTLFITFRKGSHFQQIVIILDSFFSIILGICFFIYRGIDNRIIPVPEKQFISFWNQYGSILSKSFSIACLIIVISLVIAAAIKKEGRANIKHFLILSIALFFVIPMILLLIVNIFDIVFYLIVFAMALFILFMVLSGLGEGSSSGSFEHSSIKGSGKKKMSAETTTNKKAPSKVKSFKLSSGVHVRKVHGYQHDYVQSYNYSGGYGEICSLYDLRKGNFIIYDKDGKQLGENDIPWDNGKW